MTKTEASTISNNMKTKLHNTFYSFFFFKTMKFPQLARIVTEKEFYQGILPILVTACSKNEKKTMIFRMMIS